jgi:hypothetical protein
MIIAPKYNTKTLYRVESLFIWSATFCLSHIIIELMDIAVCHTSQLSPLSHLLNCKRGWNQLIGTVICDDVMDTPIWQAHYLTLLEHPMVGWKRSTLFHVIFILVCFNRDFLSCLWFALKYSISHLSKPCLLNFVILWPYDVTVETINSKCT